MHYDLKLLTKITDIYFYNVIRLKRNVYRREGRKPKIKDYDCKGFYQFDRIHIYSVMTIYYEV